jgi:channel protein (hemolysin III family)
MVASLLISLCLGFAGTEARGFPGADVGTELDPGMFLGFNDPVASMSHLFVGAPLFFGLTILLILRGHGHPGRQFTLALYGATNVLLFALSGVYHLLPPDSPGRLVLRRLDHAAIFCLIAGTFTPAHYILFRGWFRWFPLVLIWAAAVVGVVLKTAFFDEVSEAFGLTLYLAMGWCGLISGFFIWYQYGPKLVLSLLVGALIYTAGAVLDFLRWPTLIPGVLAGHELFHLAVVLGAVCFWYCIYLIAPGNYPKVLRDEALPLQ